MRYFSMYAGIAGFEKGIEDAKEIAENKPDNSPHCESGTPQHNRCSFRQSDGEQQANTETSRSGDSIIPEVPKPKQPTLRWNNTYCVGYSELDRYATAIYKYHYTSQRNYGDATRIVPDELPDFDCIVAGFPCQSFSIAGKRQAFSDIRGTLFFEICRIAQVKRPAYLWLENVKGLLSAPYTETIQEWAEEDFDENGEPTKASIKKHRAIPGTKGWVFLTILNTLRELGYDCQWQLLNSKYHGVPQNRERVFIVGHLREGCRPKIFPIRNSNEKDTELQGYQVGAITARRGNAQSDGDYIIEGNGKAQGIVQALDANYAKGNAGFAGSKRALVFKYGIMGEKNKKWLEDGKELSRNFPQGQRVYDTEGISAQLTAQGGGWGAKTGLYQVNISKESGGKQPYQQNRIYSSNGLSPAIPSQLTDMYKTTTQTGIRRLTPIECERLQGFPDNWTKYGLFEDGQVKEISDTQRYKCLGNAVTTNVIRDIILQWEQ